MNALRALAPAKFNLCLYLGQDRSDGRHELVSVVQSVSLVDEVELAPAPDAGGDEVVCPGVRGPNLAADALAVFRAATGWDAPPVRVTVRKRIPVAGGMGGGSADAAAVLRLAAAVTGRADMGLLRELAVGLGADVPAALEGGCALVTGAGENVRQLPAPAPYGVLVLRPPGERLLTADVFAEADRLGLPRDGGDLAARRRAVEKALADGSRLPPELVHNDLEPAARSLCPGIGPVLDAAEAAGAAHAMVSGSGPAVVGLYPGEDGAGAAMRAADALADDFPGARSAVSVDVGFGEPRPVIERPA